MSTKQEIMDKLDKLKVEYDSSAKKSDLEALLPVEEEPVAEEPVAKEPVVEEPVVEEPKKKDLGPYAGKELGTSVVYISRDVEINGKQYIEVSLVDGTTTVLSEKDLEKQIKTK
jgi:hypothetical protein